MPYLLTGKQLTGGSLLHGQKKLYLSRMASPLSAAWQVPPARTGETSAWDVSSVVLRPNPSGRDCKPPCGLHPSLGIVCAPRPGPAFLCAGAQIFPSWAQGASQPQSHSLFQQNMEIFTSNFTSCFSLPQHLMVILGVNVWRLRHIF